MFVRCSEGSDCSLDFVETDSVVVVLSGIDCCCGRSDCSCCCKGSEESDVEDDFHNES